MKNIVSQPFICECGYSLEGLDQPFRCPECGVPIAHLMRCDRYFVHHYRKLRSSARIAALCPILFYISLPVGKDLIYVFVAIFEFLFGAIAFLKIPRAFDMRSKRQRGLRRAGILMSFACCVMLLASYNFGLLSNRANLLFATAWFCAALITTIYLIACFDFVPSRILSNRCRYSFITFVALVFTSNGAAIYWFGDDWTYANEVCIKILVLSNLSIIAFLIYYLTC